MHARQITYDHWGIDLPPYRIESNPAMCKLCEIPRIFLHGNSSYAIRLGCVAANRHAGQVGYSHSPRQEVRHGPSRLRADSGEEGEGQAAHAAACAAAERERQSDLPFLWGLSFVVLHLEVGIFLI